MSTRVHHVSVPDSDIQDHFQLQVEEARTVETHNHQSRLSPVSTAYLKTVMYKQLASNILI